MQKIFPRPTLWPKGNYMGQLIVVNVWVVRELEDMWGIPGYAQLQTSMTFVQ